MLAVATIAPGAAHAAGPAPWRLTEALDLPAWLALSVQHRVRYETLDEQFRAFGEGGDQALVLRTTALLEATRGDLRVGAELIDSRLLLDDAGTPVDTSQSDSLDLLQAYGAWRIANPLGLAAAGELKLGRQTLDLGSRRLAARNSFRNTINAFTGLDVHVAGTAGWEARAFAVMPVQRQPLARAELARDRASFDEEDTGTVFWTAHYGASLGDGEAGPRYEIYLVGLNESDARFATRDRGLYTPGFRLYREPAPSRVDFELESMLQFGTSRAGTAAADRRDLDHFAHYQHGQLGYTFAVPMRPRLLAQFDYASGDEDPDDGDNGRFDTLFGARRFELGPTGIWGAFARANLMSPGWRLQFDPAPRVKAMVGHRAFWLAAARDAWTAAGVRDRTGAAGRFVGHQVEWNAAWTLVPGNLTLEAGGAWLSSGEFADRAPSASDEGDASYLYTQLVLTF